MHYDPRHDPCPLLYDHFKSCTVPRPIGWLSTVSRDGRALPNVSGQAVLDGLEGKARRPT